MRCTRKLLKVKSKLILIPFTSFVDFFFFIIQNVVGKIDKKTLQIGFRINPTFWFKKITYFKLTWFHYNKSIHLSPLPTTKLNEIHKKKKEF